MYVWISECDIVSKTSYSMYMWKKFFCDVSRTLEVFFFNNQRKKISPVCTWMPWRLHFNLKIAPTIAKQWEFFNSNEQDLAGSMYLFLLWGLSKIKCCPIGQWNRIMQGFIYRHHIAKTVKVKKHSRNTILWLNKHINSCRILIVTCAIVTLADVQLDELFYVPVVIQVSPLLVIQDGASVVTYVCHPGRLVFRIYLQPWRSGR